MNKICKASLFSAILACVTAMPADSAVKTNNSNRSYAGAYNQVNALRYQQEYSDTNVTTASATATLPVMVADKKLASAILNNSSATTVAHLESCSMIYPNGVFRWEIPTSGIRRNQTNQCVAVVSLIDANTNAVLATTTLAAGDTMKCNIDSFPESGMNEAIVEKTELPADMAPTMEDVEAVMNKEQKQNAGFKIAAAAIIGGVAGNALGKKEAGDTKMFGTGKTQLIDTAIGTAAGAGIMAASSYSGKVAGDTIKSTAVNATSGMIIGNMLAGASSSDSIVATTKCKLSEAFPKNGEYADISSGEYDCIVGKIQTIKADDTISSSDGDFYIVNQSGTKIKECDASTNKCTDVSYTYVDIEVIFGAASKPLSKLESSDYVNGSLEIYNPDEYEKDTFKKVGAFSMDNSFLKIYSAKKTDNTVVPAYKVYVSPLPTKLTGYKKADIDSLSQEFVYVYRNNDGTLGRQITTSKKDVYFTPSSRDASDGGLVDLSNQARTKGTLVGTAAGGAMGGFAGYQGAKSEMTDRWTAAVREYEDSLSNFVCMTGNRYLSKYNDYVEIPEMNKTE